MEKETIKALAETTARATAAALVGNAGFTALKSNTPLKKFSEDYKGHTIDYIETEYEYAYFVDGMKGLKRATSIYQARQFAREKIDG